MGSPIKPLGDRVVAVREEAQEKTASGLYLPDNAKEKLEIFTVLAVGKDVKIIKVGDKIAYTAYVTPVNYQGTEYYIVKEEDVSGTVE
jgi:chaperonin GroES